jgi:hypothetical protein
MNGASQGAPFCFAKATFSSYCIRGGDLSVKKEV